MVKCLYDNWSIDIAKEKMIYNILYFPGVLFHELAHLLMCLVLGVKVRQFKVSIRDISGFVVHEVPRSIIMSILIGIAPIILAVLATYFLLDINHLIKYYFAYVILYHSFPSKEDTNFSKHHGLGKKIITFPIFILLRLIHLFGSSSWLRLTYSVVVIVVFDNYVF